MQIFFVIVVAYTKLIVDMLLFRQISGQKIKWLWFIFVPLVYVLLFFFNPSVGYVSYFFIFIIYNFCLNRYKNRLLDLFYGLYPIVIESLVGRFLVFDIFPLVGISIYSEKRFGWYHILVELLIFPIYLLLVNSLKIDFKELRKGFDRHFFNRFLWVINISMVVYNIVVSILFIFRNQLLYANVLRGHVNGVYIMLFFIMLLYINATSKERLEKELLQQKDIQLQELYNYSHHVEALYSDIRSFRHDYINILISLKLSIENQDMDAIKMIYENVLKDSADPFYHSKFDIAKLSHIENDAVKSVIFAKLLEAQSKGIAISVEIEEAISDFKIELLDFIRILSILCDNAIEASLESDDPKMALAFIKDGSSLILVIENSTPLEKIDVSHLFVKRSSTKGEGRGIGLINVKHIMEKYSKSSIITKSSHYLFSQTITFRK